VSVEFADHKEYSPGDEVKRIDWKVLGRSDKVYIKRYHHETDLTAFLLVDASGSMSYGSSGTMKYRAASIAALAVSYLLLRQGDRVSLMTASDHLSSRVPARAGLGHFQALSETLDKTEPSGETAIGAVLGDAVEQIGRRKVVFVFTDAFEPPEDLFRPMRALRARGCSVLLVHTLHSHELDFPFEHVCDFRSLEEPGNLVTEPQLIRSIYMERMKAHTASIVEATQNAGIGYLLLKSDEALETPLFELLKKGIS